MSHYTKFDVKIGQRFKHFASESGGLCPQDLQRGFFFHRGLPFPSFSGKF